MRRGEGVGIFASEIGERFLRVLILLCEHCFADLHAELGVTDTYAACLDRVGSWSDLLVREQLEGTDAPDLVRRLEDAYEAYVALVFPELGGKPAPTVEELARGFLVHASRAAAVRDGAFFGSAQCVVRRAVCMDAMRDTLHELARGDEAVDDHIMPSDSISNIN